MISAFRVLLEDVSGLKAENSYLKELSREAMQQAPSASQEKNGKKLHRLSTAAPIGMHEVFVKGDQPFVFCLAREVAQKCTEGDSLHRD